MHPVLRIARTEMLEHRRQPAMLSILALNYLVWSGGFGLFFLFFQQSQASPEGRAQLEQQAATMGVALDAVMNLATSTLQSLSVTNLPLFVAIMAGTAVLRDKETGTLAFLLLAPVTRLQLLVGKLLGALAIPLCFHVLFVGGGSLLFGAMPALRPWAFKFGGSAAWWAALLAGAPCSAAFVGALGTVISGLSRDVRTSMQFTSFVMGLLSLGIGAVLIDALREGLAVQLAFAALALAATVVTLAIGARVISRDVGA